MFQNKLHSSVVPNALSIQEARRGLHVRGTYNRAYSFTDSWWGPMTGVCVCVCGGGGRVGRPYKRKFTHIITVFTAKDITYTVLYISNHVLSLPSCKNFFTRNYRPQF